MEMRRFEFKFAAVLKQRKTLEEHALRALGAAQRVHRAEVERKEGLVSELEAALVRRESLGIEPVGPAAFRLEQDFITGTKQRIIQADQAILRATRGVEKALRAYLHAKKQCRMIEVLKEKAYADYRKARTKFEQRQQDDFAVMRARLRAEIA
jgi:flagellar FliJ protein